MAPTELKPDDSFAFVGNGVVKTSEFDANAASIADRIPQAGKVLNLCEDRYRFMLAFRAALSRRATTLLPYSHSSQAIGEMIDANAGCMVIDDRTLDHSTPCRTTDESIHEIPDFMAAVGHTSGTTGVPSAHVKWWSHLQATTALNADTILAALAPRDRQAPPCILATVPPQHMYGFEMSVLLPLLAGFRVHCGRPLLPADVAESLASMPEPRVFVSTPVHLRMLIGSTVNFPEVSIVVSATAPLSPELAGQVERRMGAVVIEMFGSTETCVIATRRPAQEAAWRPYPQIRLEAHQSGTKVSGPWLPGDQLLGDSIDLHADGTFSLAGRGNDIVEVAGKRASLADLTRRLTSLEGVVDAIVFQPPGEPGEVRRCAAVVVAPGLDAREVLDRMRSQVDAVFLPRPLVIVPQLPRNEVGKLPLASLLEILATGVSRPRRER